MTTNKWPVALGLVSALAVLAAGLHDGASALEGWHLAARWTARTGFLIFLAVYLASSLVRLHPAGWTRSLARNRRWWGLGFAASHTVHLLALVMALRFDPAPRTVASLVPGTVAYLFILAMAATSSNPAMRALGPTWKRLHMAGIHVIWLIFTLAYAKRIPVPETRAIGIFMTTLALAALATRLVARRARPVAAAA